MIDPTPNEEAAMRAGGAAGGEYLEHLGRADLAALTPDEWSAFIEAVITAYTDTLQDLAAQDTARIEARRERIPFP